jgi:hypothetical protein
VNASARHARRARPWARLDRLPAVGAACLSCCALIAVPRPADAQQAQPARVAVETVAAVDTSIDDAGHAATGVTADALVSVGFGHDLQGLTRPFLQRNAATGEWSAQIWLAALRYERGEQTAVRIDAGYIPSPIGMANLLLRPHTNPTIGLPASLFTALPQVDPGGPRTTLLGAIYPLGVSATVSSLRWDVRGAIIDTSPSRSRRVLATYGTTNPPRFANVVIGAGMTPVVGVRVGASVTHGGWERAGESPSADRTHDATLMTLEAEVSYRHSRLQAEWARNRFATTGGTVAATGWFVQGMQTLSPRWFVAGRAERMSSPAVTLPMTSTASRSSLRLIGFEETLGVRLNPDLTLRVGHRLREGFGEDDWGHVVAASLVWWRRWR